MKAKQFDAFNVLFWEYLRTSNEYHNNFGVLGYEEMKPYSRASLKAVYEIKYAIKNVIKEWQVDNLLADCYNRIEFRIASPYTYWVDPETRKPKIELGNVHIYSSYGSITKAKWLNKIGVNSFNGYVSTQVARTDKRFLGDELPTKLSEFVVSFLGELNEQLLQVWSVYKQGK